MAKTFSFTLGKTFYIKSALVVIFFLVTLISSYYALPAQPQPSNIYNTIAALSIIFDMLLISFFLGEWWSRLGTNQMKD